MTDTKGFNSTPFKRAYQRQKEAREKLLVPLFYDKMYPGRHWENDSFQTPLEKWTQLNGIDTIVQMSEGNSKGFETYDEKMDFCATNPRKNFFFEHISSINKQGAKINGWLFSNICTYLLYCFVNRLGDGLKVCKLPMRAVQEWVRANKEKLPTSCGNKAQGTWGYTPSIKKVLKEIPNTVYKIGKWSDSDES